MKMKNLFFSILCFLTILISTCIFAQAPDEAFHPMTAPGARHVHGSNTQWFSHKLFWENPTDVIYNDVYISTDSNLVINLDPSVKILSGVDSLKIFSSLSLELLGDLEFHTYYYWRVVEYNSEGSTPGLVWNFISQSSAYSYWNDDFSNGLSNYISYEPPNATWDIYYSSNAGGNPPELLFYCVNFSDISYLIINEPFDLCTSLNPLRFNYSFDWHSGEFTIGLAYSLDEGISWIPFWQQIITEDIQPTLIDEVQVPNENYVYIALFCQSDVFNSGGEWYLDDLILDTPLTVPTPPAQIQAIANSLSQSVDLTWVSGFAPDPISGYRIQRKNGLPTDTSSYSTIGQTGGSTFNYSDNNIELNKVYTYRIQTVVPVYSTAWSNEATAYVPPVVPVELLSFTYSTVDNEITLLWTTATEINNSGFEIEREQVFSQQSSISNGEWQTIGFIPGHGTTSEKQSYSFKDENLSSGKYQYRLKQLDFDGTFEYSNTVEVEINSPTQFSLEQNYPNPFNPTTKIKYSIPSTPLSFGEGLGVRLLVYDVLGNEVATLVNEPQQPGTYEVEFKADKISSGVYYYQLIAGEFIQTRKMILIK